MKAKVQKVVIPTIQTNLRYYPRPIFELIDAMTDQKRDGTEFFRKKMKIEWKFERRLQNKYGKRRAIKIGKTWKAA